MTTFINFHLPYKDENGAFVSSEQQARSILDKAQTLIDSGVKGVAITYSANYGQTVNIHKVYNAGEWFTGTSGSNQADVMTKMEKLMETEYSDLQHLLQIAPITTMTYEIKDGGYGGKTHQEVVEADLAYIKQLLDKGWTVLGWINQDSSPLYAVGGGIASLPIVLDNLIQDTLSQYAR